MTSSAPPPHSRKLPGTVIDATFKLIKPLAEGGMGAVWIAESRAHGKKVAVKFISSRLSKEDPSVLARFRREAEALMKVRHAHILRVYGHGEDDGLPYIAMELLRGRTLADHLLNDGTLSVATTSTIVMQISEALGEAHRLGIIHRDIKPANVFLVDAQVEPHVKVLDFGMAKEEPYAFDIETATTEVTASGTMLGTPHYMSPEQLDAPGEVDTRADLWALAVLSYYALSGKHPFTGGTLAQLFRAISAAKFAPITRHGSHFPDALDRWFDKALAPDPASRFQTAHDLAQALEATARDMKHEDAQRSCGPVHDPEGDAPAATVDPARGGQAPLLPYPQALFSDPPQPIDGDELPEPVAETERAPIVVPFLVKRWRWMAVAVGVAATAAIVAVLVDSPSQSVAPDAAGTPPKRVAIAAGTFMMGCDHDACEQDERPVHAAELSPFRIDRQEVTVADYRACVDAGQCNDEGISACNSGAQGRDDHPVNCVTFDQARTFCAWRKGRLPSEAKWERAARGDAGDFPWGDDAPTCSHAIMSGCGEGTAPVGSAVRGTTRNGLHDMAGNVWEWVGDWYARDAYGKASPHNPRGPRTGTHRVIRGGGWQFGNSDTLRACNRDRALPESHAPTIGFRCAYDAR